MEIGERLKEARESIDMSLETLQERTKIQKRYLLAIENGDFHVLPGTFYSRAFIKEYAIAVGLDPNELLDEYEGQLPSSETNDDVTASYTRMQRSRQNNEPKSTAVFSFIPTVIVVVLIIGILFVAWTLYQKSLSTDDSNDVDEPHGESIIQKERPSSEEDDKDSQDKDEEDKENDDADGSDEDDAEESDEDENEGEHSWEVTEEGTGNSPTSTLLFTSGTSDVEMVIETDSETWLSVSDDTGQSQNQLLQSTDEPFVFDASDSKQITINVGNAANTTITMNDEEMKFPADPTQFVVQTLQINIEKTE